MPAMRREDTENRPILLALRREALILVVFYYIAVAENTGELYLAVG